MWINLLYVSAAIMAIAFLILVIFVSRTLSSLQRTLDRLSGTVSDLEGQMRGVTKETTELLSKTNQLADDIQKKSEALNGVVYAVKDIGDSVQRVNHAFKDISTSVTEKAHFNSEKVSQAIQWGSAAIELWEKWKEKKHKKINVTSKGE
ncbi:DUF948 domain-containing protein [Bacillus salitolerans]|uniref:DUF948 domain-containing protein n=1 Tax=Bacillus salitolerans TaxID=1437434 RepID=A0ABW4LXJ5_9BACI